MQVERARVLRHVVDEHADACRKMLAAQIADVMTAVVRGLLGEAGDETPFAEQIAHLITRQLRDA